MPIKIIIKNDQTDAFQYRPTVLISMLYLFRQCAYFSTGLILLPSLFQCFKFFRRVSETLTTYVLFKGGNRNLNPNLKTRF